MTIDKSTIRISHAETPEEALAYYSSEPSEDLAKLIINNELNDLIRNHDETVPYMGWFWRNVDFFSDRGVTIAEGDGMVAVCRNNKWGYEERWLEPDEQARFLELVWAAHVANTAGGLGSEIVENTEAALRAAGEYITSLEI